MKNYHLKRLGELYVRMIKTILSLCLVLKSQIEIRCNDPDTLNSKCICDGTEYDLSKLSPTDGNSYFSAPDANNEYMYYFQMTNGGLPSGNGTMPYCKLDSATEFGNSVTQGDITGNSCFSIGKVSQQQWTLIKDQTQVIKITFSGGQEGRQSVINFICDNEANDPIVKVKGETKTLIYEIDIITKYACKQNTYKCINNTCQKTNTTGGTLDECKSICKEVLYNCINGFCIPSITKGLNKSGCENICFNNKLKTLK